MPFVPSAGGVPFLFTPSDAMFNQALNADFQKFSTAVAFTVTVTSQAGTITSYTSTGSYVQAGKLCHVSIGILLTNIGTASGLLGFNVPFDATWNVTGACREINVSGYLYWFTLAQNTAGANLARYDNSTGFTWVNNSFYPINFTYEINI